ncbi:uncharacterized protein LOC141729850 [Zonotrichia albicollis]|uniref:uncharacterized protein LOC141729850 n=1 Tax=Zonotrichia albicollis TaxID=44394 RepID=UPI003D810BA5
MRAARPGRASGYLNVHRVPAQHTSHGVRTSFPQLPAVPEWKGAESGKRRSRQPGQQRPGGRAPPRRAGPGPPRRAGQVSRGAAGLRAPRLRPAAAATERRGRGEDAARQQRCSGLPIHRPAGNGPGPRPAAAPSSRSLCLAPCAHPAPGALPLSSLVVDEKLRLENQTPPWLCLSTHDNPTGAACTPRLKPAPLRLGSPSCPAKSGDPSQQHRPGLSLDLHPCPRRDSEPSHPLGRLPSQNPSSRWEWCAKARSQPTKHCNCLTLETQYLRYHGNKHFRCNRPKKKASILRLGKQHHPNQLANQPL